MKEEINKYLTEAMGDCWQGESTLCECGCGMIKSVAHTNIVGELYVPYPVNLDFSTWEGFGKLWEWSIKQNWWLEFLKENENSWKYWGLANTTAAQRMMMDIVNPETFANSIYDFLNK